MLSHGYVTFCIFLSHICHIEEFGSGAILFCKGADSAMLDPEVCTSVVDDPDKEGGRESEWEVAKMLGIQSHLGEFASEGLRTLVLGVRFLTDAQCDAWLAKYNTAAASIKDRDAKLTQCAFEIEKEIHVVGATAIEDKLQKNVPNTIATLAKAGIKLWVLTGDKRETAIEIGYATQVLTPQMHLTEVSDRGLEFVHAQCAMEFMRLVSDHQFSVSSNQLFCDHAFLIIYIVLSHRLF